jgi:hypothetical protein
MSDRFEFRFDRRYRIAGAAFGISPGNAVVEVTGTHLDARFGPWRIRTPLSNVVGTERSGPYSVPKTIGPARLSLADRGITFATNDDAGLCIRFADPVPGIDPLGRIRHPGLTVTVEDPGALERRLDARPRSAGHPTG